MCLTYKNHIFVVTPERKKSATGNTSNLTVFFSWHSSLIMPFIKRSWLYLKNVISRHVVSLRIFFSSQVVHYTTGGPCSFSKVSLLYHYSLAVGQVIIKKTSFQACNTYFLFSFPFQLLNMRSDVSPIARL